MFKCGPDFLDPQWLRLASGQPVHALDRWMNGEVDVRARLFQAAQSNDVLLIEGVMGLFDGANSAAELAKSLGISAVVVVDASAMAATFGAIAHGLQHYDPGLQLAGCAGQPRGHCPPRVRCCAAACATPHCGWARCTR
ncbi:hypothetical protein [Comamonas sp. JC664]|uniref:hypothetical protein n=1 Tax=Comamonas sp. JC664 TaxID=2801917 RepID=UPI00360711EF